MQGRYFDDVEGLGPLLHRPDLPVLDEVAEVRRQRLGAEVQVHEHPARPGADLACGRQNCSGSTWGKSQGLGMAARRPWRSQVKPWKGQRSSATQPGSVRSWRPRCRQELWNARMTPPGPRTSTRELFGDVVDEGVARLGDVLLPAGDLPHPLPQLLDLEVVPGPGEVPLPGDVLGAEVDGRLAAQRLGDGDVLLVEEVLDGGDRQPSTGSGVSAVGAHRRTSKPAATRSQVASVTPRSRSRNFWTRPVGVRGRSSSTSK